jgi:hypothetical protein
MPLTLGRESDAHRPFPSSPLAKWWWHATIDLVAALDLAYITQGTIRLQLAIVFSGRPRTLYEAAALLGKHSSDIRKTVHRMHDDGLLAADPEPRRKGTVFSVKDEHQGLLDQALAEAQPPGYCLAGQRALEVQRDKLEPFYRVIKKREFSSVIAWMIELDGAGRVLLVLSHRANRRQAELLQTALEAAGHSVRSGLFGEPASGKELYAGVRGVEIAADS